MRITTETLIAAGMLPTQARVFAEPLAAACAKFGIDTAKRAGGLIGQCMVESMNFAKTEESLYYTTAERIRQVFPTRVASMADASRLVHNPQALANRVYAGRLGNGDEASGDGWKFRGRGLIQITGRSNYSAAAGACDRPYLEHPEFVGQPEGACLSAAWFWAAAGLNALADLRDWDGITRRVNGPAMLHRPERVAASERAMWALEVTP